MSEPRPVVVRPAEATAGPTTPGMERRRLFEHRDRWVGWVRTDAGVVGGWHHHGGHDSYIYVLRGAVTVEFGPGGRESVRAGAGDFIFTPAWLVHRETSGTGGDVEAVVVRVGDGPQLVNLDGPDPG